MDKIRNFLREKAVLLVVVACIVVAAGAGIWAVRSVKNNLMDGKGQDGTSGADDAGLEPYPGMDDNMGGNNEWEAGLDAAGKAEGVPEQDAQSGQQASSASSSGSGSASSSGTGHGKSGAHAAAGAPSCTQPVSGSVVNAFSGDELVFSKTLQDWRTHNGTDYACGTGEAVYAPATGKVSKVETDGNWGGVVEITDEQNRVWRLCGVGKPLTAVGDAVVTGQQVGSASTIGCENAEGSHIHLEVLSEGKYMDPAELME
jgi:murein DD-endopeptidase MepM/ murein hydrolase activator NlpD